MEAKEQQEGLIEDQADSGQAGTISLMMVLGLAFLTFNSGTAIHRSDGSFAAVGFVVFSYMDLILLFCCLWWFKRAPPGSPTRERLKVTIWVLMALLISVYSYKIDGVYQRAAIMIETVRTLVRAMAAATELGSFFAFFLHRQEETVCTNCPAPHSWLSLCTSYYLYVLHSELAVSPYVASRFLVCCMRNLCV